MWIVKHRLFKCIIKPEKLDHIILTMQKYGPYFIIGGRQIFGLRSQLFIASGIIGISPYTFLLFDAIGALLTITIMVTIGYTGTEIIQNSHIALHNPGIYFGILLIALCIIGISILVKRQKNKNNVKMLQKES
jgi:membrane protein DedA with SNARE-associated domain